LLLLLTRLQWEPDGQPLVPGGLDLWKQLLRQKSDHAVVRERGKAAASWTSSDQLLESMFAFAKLESDDSPLRMYLLLSAMDSSRGPHHRLKPETFQLMAKRFSDFNDQYEVFSEFPELDDASIVKFIDTASGIEKISNHTLRGNTMGAFQANIG